MQRSIRVNPTLDTSAFAANDQVGPAATKLTGVMNAENGIARLQSIIISDASKQKAVLDLLFFNSLPTMTSVENAAYDISDAEAKAKFLGRVSIIATDYLDNASNSLGGVHNLNRFMRALKNTDNSSGKDLWFNMQLISGTPTFAATALQFEFIFETF